MRLLRVFCHSFFQLAAIAGCLLSEFYGLSWAFPVSLVAVVILTWLVEIKSIDDEYSALQTLDIEIKAFRFINRGGVLILCLCAIYWLVKLKFALKLDFVVAGLINLMSLSLVAGQYLHELCHSKIKIDRIFCKIMSIAVGYGHFKREHTYHHEKRVFGAMLGESFYAYMNRNYFGGFQRSYGIESGRVEKKPTKYLSNSIISNYTWLVFVFLVMVGLLGVVVSVSYLVVPITFLISTQLFFYVSHYGFVSSEVAERRGIAWDSPSLGDRLLFANSGRHSEHHKNPDLPHYMLGKRSMGKATLPKSYPVMMLLALIPPVWYWMMDKRVDKVLTDSGGTMESEWDKGRF